MIDKAMNGINCGQLNVTVEQLNETAHELEKANATFYNVRSSGAYPPISLGQEVCRAEIESQKLVSTISGYMAPLGNLKI